MPLVPIKFDLNEFSNVFPPITPRHCNLQSNVFGTEVYSNITHINVNFCVRIRSKDGWYSRYPRYTAVPNFTVLVPWGSRYTVEVTVLFGNAIL